MVRDNENWEMYDFCDPAAIFTNSRDIQTNLVNRLKEGNPDRLFLLPYNTKHLVLIDHWNFFVISIPLIHFFL